MPLKWTDLSSCVSAKKFMNLMLSIYTQEGCQNSVQYLGVDGESEPVVPQVVAKGPVTEQPGNQRPHTLWQLTLQHVLGNTSPSEQSHNTHSPCIRSADQ